MVNSRYKKQIVLFLVLFLLAVLSFGLFSLIVNEPGFTNLLPTNNMMLQATFIFILIPITTLIGGLFTGYFLGPLFLLFYKKTIGIQMDFGIQTRLKPKVFMQTWKGIFPAFMAINFALMIGTSQFGIDLIVRSDYATNNPGLAPLIGFIVSLPLMSGISMGLFSPVWFLLDSGIVFTNKTKVRDKIEPIEVRSIGGWYHYLLKGYAGIGVVVSYIIYVINILREFNNPLDGGFISAAVSLWIMPILLSIFCLPTLIILDLNLESRRRFILKFAKKLGIEKPLENPFDLQKS